MKYSKKQVFYDDLIFQVFEHVYEPAEDSFLVAETLTKTVKEDDTVLDIGTGCGLLAVIAARNAKKVMASDINPHAVKCAKVNAASNNVASKITFFQGDLLQPIPKTAKFNIIVFNAPYLPCSQSEQRTWIGRAWAGGSLGRQFIDRFIAEAPGYLKKNGRILLVQSSLACIDETLRRFKAKNFAATVIADKKVAFETIVVVQASRSNGK